MELRPHSYTFDAFRLDLRERALYASAQRIVLTPKAVETLIALVERHGRLVTKDELFQLVWPNSFVEENNLAQNISLLRRALGEGSTRARFIETVPKRGYRFVAAVEAVVDEPPASSEPPVYVVDNAQVASEAAPPQEARRSIDPPTLWAMGVAAVVLAVVALFATARMRDGNERPVRHIAVLPFTTVGSDGRAYLATGLTEEIANRLARLNGLAVPSSTTIATYDRGTKDMTRIGSDLRVDYLLDGTVDDARADGVGVTVTPKLVRVADGTVIWTQAYEAPLEQLSGVQAQISQQIVAALQVALDARERRAVETRPTLDAEAYLAFLRGIAAYRDGFSDTTNQARARTDLEQAVARDPQFALAWSWLARTYSSQYRSGADRTASTHDAAYRAARTAIALDPGLAEAHLALSQAHFADRHYAGARAELEIARAGLPNSGEVWQQLGHLEQSEGHWKQAREAFLRGFEVDPTALAQWVTVHYLHMRDYPEARRFIGIARAASQAAPVVPDAWLRFSDRGDVAAARPVLEAALAARSPADARVRGLLARLEWFDGRYARALELIEGMDAAGSWMPPNFRYPAAVAAGQVYESMGRRQEALNSFAAAWPKLKASERASPDDYQLQAGLALASLGLQRPAEALRYAQRAATLLPISKDAVEGTMYLYLLAQVQAQAGDAEAAFATLDRLFTVPGFYNEHWVQRDPGFASLWTHRAFREHVARWAMQRGDVLLQQ